MFTGIITHKGRVRRVEGDDERRLTIASDLPLESVPIGASICHSGVCLTVTGKGAGWHVVEASAETLLRTTVGAWTAGASVNLERSLRLGDELGGHLVFGHVDAVGSITELTPVGDSYRLVVSLPAELAPMVAVKGSIAVDGISLTVNHVDAASFAVTIIPHTYAHTTLADKQVGALVNLEADMLARYVARQTDFLRQGR